MGKIIYREGVACCCNNAAINEEREGRQEQKGFAVIQNLQDFLRDLCGFPKWPLFFHRPWRFQGFVPAYPGLKSRDRNTSCKRSLQP